MGNQPHGVIAILSVGADPMAPERRDTPNPLWRPSHQPAALSLPECPPAGIGLGRVAYADAAQHRDILLSLLRALRGAKQRVWLATPYFLPTWKIRRALRRAAASVDDALRS